MEYKSNIENLTLSNKYYRKVLYTDKNQQLVIMNIPPHSDIGMEKHKHTTQFIRVEDGNGIAIVDNNRYLLRDGNVIVIPPNSWHNIINSSNNDLKLYTIYSPPEHAPDTKEKFKMV